MFVIVHLSRGKDAAQRDSAIREKSGGTRSETSSSEICTLREDIKACPKVSKARSGKRQRLDVVHAEWGGKKGNVG